MLDTNHPGMAPSQPLGRLVRRYFLVSKNTTSFVYSSSGIAPVTVVANPMGVGSSLSGGFQKMALTILVGGPERIEIVPG